MVKKIIPNTYIKFQFFNEHATDESVLSTRTMSSHECRTEEVKINKNVLKQSYLVQSKQNI